MFYFRYQAPLSAYDILGIRAVILYEQYYKAFYFASIIARAVA